MSKPEFIFMDSKPKDRKKLIMDNMKVMLEKLESEGLELSGYINFVFFSTENGIETSMQHEGFINPMHVFEALTARGIAQEVKLS